MSNDFRDYIGITVIDDNGTICHFGTKGMRHGQRRYQYKDGSLTPAGRLRYLKGSRPDAKRKEKKFYDKVNKQQRDQDDRKRVEEEEKQAFLDNKKRILREGTAQEILKYQAELTTNELKDAVNRINYNNQLKGYAQADLDKGWKAVDQVMSKIGKVSGWTKTSVEAYNNIQSVKKIMSDFSKTQSKQDSNSKPKPKPKPKPKS